MIAKRTIDTTLWTMTAVVGRRFDAPRAIKTATYKIAIETRSIARATARIQNPARTVVCNRVGPAPLYEMSDIARHLEMRSQAGQESSAEMRMKCGSPLWHGLAAWLAAHEVR